LSRKIERHVEGILSVFDQKFEALVGLMRHSEPRVLAHGERPLAVHERMNPAREGEFAWLADVARGVNPLQIFGTVHGFDGDARFQNHISNFVCHYMLLFAPRTRRSPLAPSVICLANQTGVTPILR
jgi:hypothetical protein